VVVSCGPEYSGGGGAEEGVGLGGEKMAVLDGQIPCYFM
jgi:hypothetical protein